MKKKRQFENISRLVVKVGTRVLTGPDNLILEERLGRLADQVVRLQQRDIGVVLVSSGAVGAGLGRLGLVQYPRLIPDRQAVAAVGQVRLMKMWEDAFSRHDKNVGQVLTTAGDFQNRRRYVNLQNTFERLLRMGVVPVVNENDSVAVRELQYGDNDNLSAQVTCAVDARILVMLTDIDGLYTANPRLDPKARRLSQVGRITPEMIRSTRGKGSEVSIGGMSTKLKAAGLVTESGRYCVIADGSRASLEAIVNGEDVGTLFLPSRDGMTRRKQWIAFTSRSRGTVAVDDGARKALLDRGSSLLASGITSLSGRFESGDVVDIVSASDNQAFAKGVTSYGADDVDRIKGIHSSRIEDVLGRKAPAEVVHKDNLVLVNRRAPENEPEK